LLALRLLLAALASTRAVFSLFFPIPMVLFFFAMRMIGDAAWRWRAERQSGWADRVTSRPNWHASANAGAPSFLNG